MWKSLIAVTLIALPAQAFAGSMPCSDRADVLSQLGTKYKEAPAAVGVANNGGLIEVLTSTDGSTWTIILSMPNGKSCLLAAGEEWHAVEKVALDEPQI
ncbi:MAG TPA: hypothetical protein VH835_17195 [Dongiaceae bacterium]|jgi:hypothetical protein